MSVKKGERAWSKAVEFAEVLHSGDVDSWMADALLSMLDPVEFEERVEKLIGARREL